MTFHKYWLVRVDELRHGYRYLVTKDSMSFSAFRTLAGARRFLRDYGLIPQLVERKGQWASFKLIGAVSEEMTFDKDYFFSLKGEETWRLSNGQFTLHKIIRESRLTRLVHLNPNVRDRPTCPNFHE